MMYFICVDIKCVYIEQYHFNLFMDRCANNIIGIHGKYVLDAVGLEKSVP